MISLLKKAVRYRRVKILQRGVPYVILVVGVNGVGKTTTIAKLARYHQQKFNRQVIVAAGDTFRAAAIDQLQLWGERIDVPVIAHQPGADPGAVAFDAMQAAHKRNADVLIIDTAGRLHTKDNLMQELGKIRRVVQKTVPDAPQEVLLVIDANTGQNGLAQAAAFAKMVEISDVALTKLDGTSKGGIAFSIVKALGRADLLHRHRREDGRPDPVQRRIIRRWALLRGARRRDPSLMIDTNVTKVRTRREATRILGFVVRHFVHSYSPEVQAMAMFESLSDRLQGVFQRIGNRGRLTEKDIDEAMREVRRALIEADVNLGVVKEFIAAVKERSLGAEVLKSLTPGQQVIKIVNEELVTLLGTEQVPLARANQAPTIIMLVGLQGAGKTTHAAKLGVHLRKAGRPRC